MPGSIFGAMLGGGLGGALGVLIAAVINRWAPQKWKQTIAASLAVALGIIGGRVGSWYGESQSETPAAIQQELLGDRDVGALMSAWRDSDPTSFDALANTVSQQVRAGANRSTIVDAARAQVIAAAMPRMAHLEDSDIVTLIGVTRDQFRDMERRHPQSCQPLFLGRPVGDITPYLSTASAQGERALLAKAFHADMNAQRDVLRGASLERAINNLLTATRSRVGDDISLLSNGANVSGREARYCEVVATFFDVLAQMPPADAAALMRGLRASS